MCPHLLKSVFLCVSQARASALVCPAGHPGRSVCWPQVNSTCWTTKSSLSYLRSDSCYSGITMCVCACVDVCVCLCVFSFSLASATKIIFLDSHEKSDDHVVISVSGHAKIRKVGSFLGCYLGKHPYKFS